MSNKTNEIKALYDEHMVPVYTPEIALVSGSGSRVVDADNMQYIDLTAGIATLACGHCHPAVVKAVTNQANTLIHGSNLFFNPWMAKLSERLSTLAGGYKTFFGNSGAEANENMVKIARRFGADSGRYEIITFNKGFHGRTLAMCAATAQEKIQAGFDPMPTGFAYADYNNLESVKAALSDKTVAIMLEPVQGEGGVIPATQEFMDGIAALCKEHNLLLLMDEIQCGMGRTGSLFAWEQYGVKPDMFTLAKALGGGLPLGCVLVRPDIADTLKPGMLGSTFGGNPCACAAAMAVLDTIEEENLPEHARQVGDLFREGLEGLMETFPQILDVRGRGLMIGMQVEGPAKEVVDACRMGGVLCCTAGANTVRFLPPLNIPEKDLEEALEIISDSLEELYGEE